MALRMLENFTIYNRTAANLTRRWTTLTQFSTNVSLAAGGRNGADCLSITSANAIAINLSRTFDAQATWIVGFALKVTLLSPTVPVTLMRLYDGTTLHIDVQLNPDGTIAVLRNATSLGATVFALSINTMYYVEVKVTISDTVGVVTVRVNGDPKLSLTNQDTRNAGNASANRVQLSAMGSVSTIQFSDLYAVDGSATAPNDFLGDIRVDMLNPDAAGSSHVWIGSDADHVDNQLLVDDAGVPDDDTTYVETSTAGDIDLHSIADTASGAVIAGVEVLTLARKTDAGARTMRVKTRQSGTNYDGATLSLADTYTYLSQLFALAPDGSAWTEAILNALEVGYELVA